MKVSIRLSDTSKCIRGSELQMSPKSSIPTTSMNLKYLISKCAQDSRLKLNLIFLKEYPKIWICLLLSDPSPIILHCPASSQIDKPLFLLILLRFDCYCQVIVHSKVLLFLRAITLALSSRVHCALGNVYFAEPGKIDRTLKSRSNRL